MSTSRPAPTRPRPHPALAQRRREVARARGRRRRSVALIAVAALVLAAALYWAATGPLVAVSGVSVSGYDRPDRPELESALRSAAADGTILVPATGRMEAAAHRFAWVESISVSRRWPRELAVEVVPATPAAVAAFEDQAVLVSEAGRVLGIKDGVRGLGWLRLETSPPPEGASLPADARAALAFIAADPEVGARVRALRTTSTGRVLGRLDGGPELRLGAPRRMEAKARSLALLLAAVSEEEIRGASYVDLSVPENPALGPPS